MARGFIERVGRLDPVRVASVEAREEGISVGIRIVVWRTRLGLRFGLVRPGRGASAKGISAGSQATPGGFEQHC